MSIERQIEDAVFLYEAGRYHGALNLLLSAFGASSVKMFPKGTKSRSNPSDSMRDGERFKLCVGYGLRRALSRTDPDPLDEDYGRSGFTINYADRGPKLLENILYKDYRCSLIHEAELPDHVGFDDLTMEPGITHINGFRMVVRDNILVLDYKTIEFLIDVLRDLPINGGPELPKKKKPSSLKLRIRTDVDEDELFVSAMNTFALKKSKVEHLKEFFMIERNYERDFATESNDTIQTEFKVAIDNGDVNKAIIRSYRSPYDWDKNLYFPEVISDDGVLTEQGIKLIRLLSNKFEPE